MATPIKSVPILKKRDAVRFNTNAKNALSKKGSVKFTQQVAISAKILAKAKI